MDKKSTLNILAFIHNKLKTIQFYPDEFESAHKALNLVAAMATKIDEELKQEETSATEASNEQ